MTYVVSTVHGTRITGVLGVYKTRKTDVVKLQRGLGKGTVCEVTYSTKEVLQKILCSGPTGSLRAGTVK